MIEAQHTWAKKRKGRVSCGKKNQGFMFITYPFGEQTFVFFREFKFFLSYGILGYHGGHVYVMDPVNTATTS